MRYFFAEIKDDKIIAIHESTSLDIKFADSDGLLVGLNEMEHDLIKACHGNIDVGVSRLMKLSERIRDVVTN